MLNLLPLLVTLLSAGTDVLPRVLKILESYLLLDASRVLQVSVFSQRSRAHSRLRLTVSITFQLCSNDLFVAFGSLLGELKLSAAKSILHALNTVFLTSPVELWATALDSSNALIKLVRPMTGNVRSPIFLPPNRQLTL